MAELMDAVASWQSLLLVLFVFGIAPGVVLRLLVLAYPRSDPRRTELIAELYAVPRLERPLWVAEQLEVAAFEGVITRLRARGSQGRRSGRIKTWRAGVIHQVKRRASAYALLCFGQSVVGMVALVSSMPAGTLSAAILSMAASVAIIEILSWQGHRTEPRKRPISDER